MKRIILTLATIAAVAGPFASSAQARDRDHREDRWDRHEERWDRHQDRGRWDRREDRRDRREDRWDRHSGWDRGQHNGYYYNNRWAYGPPPQAYYGQPYYRPGYSSWQRGSVMPSYYRDRYVNDYGRYHLRAPPQGYAWYRAGDDYLLAAIATGLIYEIINGN